MKKQFTTFQRCVAALMVSWLLANQLWAFDIQKLPPDVAAQSGFTHIARVLYTDMTNSVNATQIRLLPRSGFAPAGFSVNRAAVYVAQPFNANWATTPYADVSIGYGGTANSNLFVNGVVIGAQSTVLPFATNTIPKPMPGSGSNWITATFYATNSSFLTNGDVWIYLQISDLARLTNSL